MAIAYRPSSVSSFLSAYSWLHREPAPSVCPGAPSVLSAIPPAGAGSGTVAERENRTALVRRL